MYFWVALEWQRWFLGEVVRIFWPLNLTIKMCTWRSLYQPQKTSCVCLIMMEELHLMCVVKITSTSHIKGSREFCHTMPLHKNLDHILSFRCTIGWSYWNWDLLLIFWPMKVQAWSWITAMAFRIHLLRDWKIERRCCRCDYGKHVIDITWSNHLWVHSAPEVFRLALIVVSVVNVWGKRFKLP